VSGSLDKTLKYWDLGSQDVAIKDGNGNCTMNFTGHKVTTAFFDLSVCESNCFQDYVLSVAVSHDGQWVVSGSKDRGVQFWDARTATVQLMLQGHKNSGM
jgi:general transcriptional corepressor TUP1